MRQSDEIPLTVAAKRMGMRRQHVWWLWKTGALDGRRESERKVYLSKVSIEEFRRRMADK